MNVVVLATASRIGGALTIYKQFLEHLKDEIGNDKYYILVNEAVPKPTIEGVQYFVIDTTSTKNRLLFDFYSGKKMMKEKGFAPDVIISLQNTGLFHSNLSQVIYYHQSIPLYPQSWSLFKKKERTLFYYKYIYPFFVKCTRNKKTQYVVQIPFIKKGMVEKFHVPANHVHTMFPDVEDINADAIEAFNWGDGNIHFLYPANGSSYKMHITLIKALKQLNDKRIKLHLTIAKGAYPVIDQLITDAGLDESIIRDGAISHSQLLSMYKGSAGLLFPSTIETIGLPLLEAAAFGTPIVAADVDYAHQVLGSYEGVEFVNPYEDYKWAEAIKTVINTPKRYQPIERQKSSWPRFFELVRNSAEKKV